jgi:hypothetical protein
MKLRPFLKLALIFGAAAASCSATHGTLNLDEINALEAPCRNVSTFADAKSCTMPFYREAMGLSDKIWADLKDAGALDQARLGAVRAAEVRGYEHNCTERRGDVPANNFEINHLMRKATFCLTLSADLAHRFKVPYETARASYLLSRTRKLIHLDIREP